MAAQWNVGLCMREQESPAADAHFVRRRGRPIRRPSCIRCLQAVSLIIEARLEGHIRGAYVDSVCSCP